MTKVLYINHTSSGTSVSKLINYIRDSNEIESLLCYGRNSQKIDASYRFTSVLGNIHSFLGTLLFNRNCLANSKETKKLIQIIENYKPDIIHIHCLLGYYIDYETLFNYLSNSSIPVVYTVHNCWSVTGYCPNFDRINCDKYKTECNNCNIGFTYPFSLFKQGIKQQYHLKKHLFNSIDNLTIVAPSNWTNSILENSFLSKIDRTVIYNGINDRDYFPSKPKNNNFTIIFVANIWSREKGSYEIEKIIRKINTNIEVIIVGKFSANKYLKSRCTLVNRTNNISELRNYYSSSHLFINPTLEEVFGLVNVEALACGTPIIAYNTGGVKEIIDDNCGVCVDKYDCDSVADLINKQAQKYTYNYIDCVNRSRLFSKDLMVNNYIKLYKYIINKNQYSNNAR